MNDKEKQQLREEMVRIANEVVALHRQQTIHEGPVVIFDCPSCQHATAAISAPSTRVCLVCGKTFDEVVPQSAPRYKERPKE